MRNLASVREDDPKEDSQAVKVFKSLRQQTLDENTTIEMSEGWAVETGFYAVILDPNGLGAAETKKPGEEEDQEARGAKVLRLLPTTYSQEMSQAGVYKTFYQLRWAQRINWRLYYEYVEDLKQDILSDDQGPNEDGRRLEVFPEDAYPIPDPFDFDVPKMIENIWDSLTTGVEREGQVFEEWLRFLAKTLNPAMGQILLTSKKFNILKAETVAKGKTEPASPKAVEELLNSLGVVSTENAGDLGWLQKYKRLQEAVKSDPGNQRKNEELEKEIQDITAKRILLADPEFMRNHKDKLGEYMLGHQAMIYRFSKYSVLLTSVAKFTTTIGDALTEISLAVVKARQLEELCKLLQKSIFKAIQLLLFQAVNTWSFQKDDEVASRFEATVENFSSFSFNAFAETLTKPDGTPAPQLPKKLLRKTGDKLGDEKDVKVYFFLSNGIKDRDDRTKLLTYLKRLFGLLEKLGTNPIDFTNTKERILRQREADVKGDVTEMLQLFAPRSDAEFVGTFSRTPSKLDKAVDIALKKLKKDLAAKRTVYTISSEQHEAGSSRLKDNVAYLQELINKKLKTELADLECTTTIASIISPIQYAEEYATFQKKTKAAETSIKDAKSMEEKQRLQEQLDLLKRNFKKVSNTNADRLLVSLKRMCQDFIIGLEQVEYEAANYQKTTNRPDGAAALVSTTIIDEKIYDSLQSSTLLDKVSQKSDPGPSSAYDNDGDWPTASAFAARRELQQFFAASRQMPRLPSTPSVLTSLFASSVDSRLAPRRRGRAAAATGIQYAPTSELDENESRMFFKLVTDEFKAMAVEWLGGNATLFDAIALQASEEPAYGGVGR